MAAPIGTTQSVVNRNKNLPESEIKSLYRNTLHCFRDGGELTAATVKYLRQVILALTYCDHCSSLPEELLQLLAKVICGSWSPPVTASQGAAKANPLIYHAVVMLSTAILQALIQGEADSSIMPIVKPKAQNTSSLLAVIFAMGRKEGRLAKLIAQMVQWVSTVGFEYKVQCSALQYLVQTANLYRDLLSEDQIFVISSQLSDWLSNASVEQMPHPSLKQKNRKPELVTEIDGGDCDDFFTILSLSQYYSPDQLMNIHTFSALRCWLQATFMIPLGEEGGASTEHSSKSVKKFTKKAKQALLDKACEYCLRVLDQCSRRPARGHDVDLIHACATESILTLDLLCALDPSLIPKLFPAVKTYYAEITEGSTSYPRAVLAALQFFINYSESVVFNAQPALEDFFDKVLGRLFSDPFLSFDVVTFLQANLEKLCYKTFILERFFPNLLKIVAWNPRSFLTDFVEILPAMTSQNTAIEMFHTLLDLPCTTAALEFRKRGELLNSNPNLADLKPDWLKSVDAIRKPENKPWFNFVLRSRGGQGDTINKLHVLHNLLAPLCTHARVLYTAEASLVLLRVFFNTVHENADYDLVTHLLPIIIERTGLIYGIQGYRQEVHNILGEELLEIFRQHPALIVDQQRELLECLSTPKNMEKRETIFIQLVWIVGEYSSASHDKRCTTEVIQKYYETLEALLYENAMTLQGSEELISTTSVELTATMMSTLAKLASQCQFLIPRVILCLTKVSQQLGKNPKIGVEERRIILARATEYVNLLKFPDIAGVILSPPEDIFSGHLHKDTLSSSVLLMRAAARLVE